MKKLFIRVITLLIITSQLTGVFAATDITGHWAEPTLKAWLDSGALTGDENGAVTPDRAITRAEFTALLMRALNYSVSVKPTSFEDISVSDWYYAPVSSAHNLGIVTGNGDNMFMPHKSITREDAIVMTGRAYKVNGSAIFNISDYHDGMEISQYALEYMSFMCENGILTGYTDKTIRPKNSITRAEAVVMLERMNEYISDPSRNIKIKFADGYPKLSSSGLSKGYNILLKVNKPSKIYYTIVNPSKNTSVMDKTKVNTFLAQINAADTETSAYIAHDVDADCSIYFKAVDEHGNESKLAIIRKAKMLYYSEGDGTEENPYIIRTQEQLDAIRYFLDKHFKLNNDIVLSGEWTPICSDESQESMFSGSLDGNGYKISNLTASGDKYVGLFGYIYTGEVKNLYVSARLVTGKSGVGIIAGGSNGGNIENCFTDGLVRAGDSYAGGIIGWNNGTVSRCESAALAIEAQSYAGGIAGWNSGNINESMSCTYSVIANMYASGIAGVNYGGRVEDCVAANMNIIDYMTENNGRITTNKSGGKTKNNYGYNKMYATVGEMLSDADNQNGLDVSWEDMQSREFYTAVLGWSFDIAWKTADEKDAFRLPYLKLKSKPAIKEGVTIYAPVRISTDEELALLHSEPQNHYILTNDIYLPNVEGGESNWVPVCGDEETAKNPENGFSGSFDGNGYTIHNMTIDYEDGRLLYGMFGVIAGGTVRNLKLDNVYISSSEICGMIAAVNYGTIGLCSVSGTILADQTESIAMTGGIAGDNYGTVQSSEANVNITARGNSTTTGGICANNEGVIIDCLAKGTISNQGKSTSSNSAIGGIAGFSTDAMIYESASEVDITARSHISYVGGVCGMLNGGEIYKTAYTGKMTAETKNALESTVYAGGITGLSSSGLVVNSFATSTVAAKGVNVYVGGVSGYNMLCHVQNCYSTGDIEQNGSVVYAGGIVGLNEEGFVTENVAINSLIRDNGMVGRVCAASTGGYVLNNYAYEDMKCGKRIFADSDLNGTAMPMGTLKDKSFYFRPVSEGGKLGWMLDGVWSERRGINPYYSFPILENVRGNVNAKADV